MDKIESLEKADVLLKQFWAWVDQSHWAKPNTDQCIRFAFTETAEAESRYLRMVDPGLNQNSGHKGRDNEAVCRELGDALFMALTAFRDLNDGKIATQFIWIGLFEEDQSDLDESWYSMFEALLGARIAKGRFKNMKVGEFIDYVIEYPGFDAYKHLMYTLIKIYNKHLLDFDAPPFLETDMGDVIFAPCGHILAPDDIECHLCDLDKN